VNDTARLAVRTKVEKLHQELLESKVNAVYRHMTVTVQYLLVLLPGDQLDDNYITLPGICDINL